MKTRTVDARKGRSRKTGDGAGDDDFHDEPISEDFTEVMIHNNN